ncbi:MAG: hypothetical protein P8015_18270 [Acidihalobacter sp.]
MSASPIDSNVMFPSVSSQPENELDNLLKLRTALVLEHPIARTVGRDYSKLFLMFELYADFVYDFTEYVCRLFMALRDEDMKTVIYDNLTDEIGIGAHAEQPWKSQHGELYRQFINSLRKIESYRMTDIEQHIGAIESASKSISRRFYEMHGVIIDERDDLQSFAAFSTIECWVCDLYDFWKRSLVGIVGNHESLDMRTIDLHCVCDAAHSAELDNLLKMQLKQDAGALHRIRKGVVRGMIASEQLFSDIQHELM